MNRERVLIPFRYPGGKFYALKILRPFWKAIEHDEYREPLVGGGSVFFSKSLAKYNWINDLHRELIITLRVMADPQLRIRLVEKVSHEIASKERHSEIMKLKPKSNLEIAYKYFYLNRTSFSGKMRSPSWGYRPKRSLPPERWKERIIPCGEKLEHAKITCMDFEKVIKAPKNGDRVLMFLDPPYFKVKQENHYTIPFEKGDHIRLYKILKKTEFKWFLTYEDCDEIRELYSWANIYPVNFFYRLDNSQKRNGSRMKGSELVITNYSLPANSPLNKFFTERVVL